MNTRMAEYIMVILKSRWQIMWSWGCCKFTALDEGLMWHVQGYLLNGWVKGLHGSGVRPLDRGTSLDDTIESQLIEDCKGFAVQHVHRWPLAGIGIPHEWHDTIIDGIAAKRIVP